MILSWRSKRTLALAVLGFGFSFSHLAFCKAWNDIVPGVTKKPDVIAKFGNPTKDISRTGELTKGILYHGKEAIEGTKQSQFFVDANDVVVAIHVFPKADVKKDQIVKTYGTNFEERLTDSFKTYLYYRQDGLVIYLEQGTDKVASLIFQKPGT